MGKFDNNGIINSYDIVNINYPVEWLTLYAAKDYHKIDPIFKINFMEFKSQYWDDTYKAISPPKHFLSQAEDFRLKKGYTCGIKSLKKKEASLFSFADNSICHHPRTRVILEHIVPHLHETLACILGRRPPKQDIVLSPREIEVRNLLNEGKGIDPFGLLFYYILIHLSKR